MQTVLVIAFTDLARDPRVHRQIQWLSKDHRVIAAGVGAPSIEGVEFVSLAPATSPPAGTLAKIKRRLRNGLTLAFRRFEHFYWSQPRIQMALDRLRGLAPDIIIANDLETLPLALRLAGRARVVFDAHEYAPWEFIERLDWRLLVAPFAAYQCRKYIPHAHAMMTVCDSLAGAYQDLVGVQATIVTNAPFYQELSSQPCGLNGRPIQLVHHGIAAPARRLENLFELMQHLRTGFELNLILMGDAESPYRKHLESLATGLPIRFLPPVPMPRISAFLNQFDIGVHLLEPVNFTNLNALPNKLFEFIQARLAVAIGPSPEMARVLQTAGCGIVADDFRPQTLASRIAALKPTDVDQLKQRASAAAYQFSADRNREIFLGLIEQQVRIRVAA